MVKPLLKTPRASVIPHNHIFIKYQQPPDPAIVNCVLEILIGVTRTFSWRNPAQVPYIQDYLNQIIPLIQTLYGQTAQQVLVQGGVPPPASNTIYLPPAYENLQKLLSELSNIQTSFSGNDGPPSVLNYKKNGPINTILNNPTNQ